MPTMKQIPLDDATARQLADFIEAHGINISATQRRSKAALQELYKTAQFTGDKILVAEGSPPPANSGNDEMAERFAKPLNVEKDEQWCRVRFHQDRDAEDKESAIAVRHNTDGIFIPRNRDVVIRERYMRIIAEAVETRRVQNNADGQSTQFNEARIVREQRYPFTWMGFVGRVQDGPPDGLPGSVAVIA